MNSNKFTDETDPLKKCIEECPPLCDPVLCKDMNKAIEAHKKFCSENFPPDFFNSKARMNMSINELPEDPE